jgi:hypothetical protein
MQPGSWVMVLALKSHKYRSSLVLVCRVKNVIFCSRMFTLVNPCGGYVGHLHSIMANYIYIPLQLMGP